MRMLRIIPLVAAAVTAVSARLPADESTDPPTDEGQLFARLDTSGDGRIEATEIESADSRLFARLVRRGDDDGDGALSAEEFAAALQLSRPPKPLTEQPNSSPPGANAARALLLMMDTEPDGVINRDEVPNRLRRAFDEIAKQADGNQDGTLDMRELARGGPRITRTGRQTAARLRIDVDRELKRIEAEQGDLAKRFDEPPRPGQVLASPQRAAALFATLDSNGDKLLEADEFPAQAPVNYRRLLAGFDADGDKALSEREFARAAQRIGRFLQDGQPPQRPTPKSPPENRSDASKPQPDDAASSTAARIVDRLVERLDKNGNGQLEADEITGRRADRVRRADLDGNGAIDADEIEAMKGVLAERLQARVPE